MDIWHQSLVEARYQLDVAERMKTKDVEVANGDDGD